MIHLAGVAAAKGVPAAATALAALVVAQGSVIDSVPGGSSATELLNGGAIVAAFALLFWILKQTLGPNPAWVPREYAERLGREAGKEGAREVLDQLDR